MADIPYTYAERTQKKYIIGTADENARVILRNKGIHEICTDAVRQHDLNTPITLVQLNELQQSIVDDSIYYRL